MAYLRLSAGGRLAGVLLATVGLCLGVAESDARPRKARTVRVVKVTPEVPRPVAPAITQSPRYAAIVIDAKTGRVLHEAQADALRHPASLTKIMTLYVLFEELEARRVALETELTVSVRASVQAPSKLGLRPGQTITVADAIRALVTKSANDVAVVVAENVSGSEEQFAARMTRTARRLGMASTLYRNASGLPNAEQITTARDLALLGRAIQERFPAYYRFFGTPSFAWGRSRFRNHNRLLGAIEGVDGIKTGYTLASGFNLVTSLKRDGRHIVAVVLGGSTARARDGRMAQLLAATLPLGSLGPQVSFVLAPGADERRTTLVAEAPRQQPPLVSRVDAEPVGKPLQLIQHTPRTLATATVVSPSALVPPTTPRDAARRVEDTWSIPIPVPSPLGYAPLAKPSPGKPRAEIEAVTRFDPVETGSIATRTPAIERTAPAAAAPAPVAAETSPMPAGWQIQVGAYDREDQAASRLAAIRGGPGAVFLGSVEPFTQPVQKGDKTLYRARFAGFADRGAADLACGRLKRLAVDCVTIHQ